MNIAIIGAGPAGIFTSIFLRDLNCSIDLYEKNGEIGKKLKLTGGGKMNISNKNFSVESFVSEEKNILRNIFKNPLANKVLSFFDEIGIDYVYEADRAILKTQDARIEVGRLYDKLYRQKNLSLICDFEVTDIKKLKNKFIINDKEYDVVVISPGSRVSYEYIEKLGHSITDIKPALCPIITNDDVFYGLEGISIECAIKVLGSKKYYEGNMIFTGQGISGPIVLDATINEIDEGIEINFLPHSNKESFCKQIDTMRNSKVMLKNLLTQFLPKRLALWHLSILNINENINISSLRKSDLNLLVKNIFTYSLKNIRKTDIKTGWTVRGGIPLNEIIPVSLESKLHKRLYFAGEVLDVTGLCGGYNISFACLSAKIVSESIKTIPL